MVYGPGTGYAIPITTGTTTSTSTSTPSVIQTPQSEYDLLFAQEAANAGNNTYNWAQQQGANLTGLANEAIPAYLRGAMSSEALANQQLGMYEGTYAPAMLRFNELANTYASKARQNQAAGQAEAASTQATDQAWQNTKNDLQAHGIDPSSGMYGGLEAATRTAGGAAAAGAGNQAIQATENTGIGLQEQNINFGSTLPASALNATNAAYAGQAGAVNTGESVANTTANALNTANNFYNTAMGIKLPTSGQNTQSNTVGTTGQLAQGMSGESGNIGGGGGVVAQGGLIEPGNDSYRRGGRVRGGGKGGARQGGGGGGGATGTPVPRQTPGPGTGYNAFLDSNDALSRGNDYGSISYDRSSSTPAPGMPGSGGAPNRGSAPPIPASASPTLDNTGGVYGGGDGGDGGDTGGYARGGGIPDMHSGAFHSHAQSIHENNVPQRTGLPVNAAQGGLMDPTMPHGHQGRPMPPHGYHMNGLPDASTGGHVPYELSPSHGHTTDDVVANLNAGEFVIPRRTVHHLGHKFLYDLIGKSDKEMGLHPQPVGAKPLKAGSGADKARSAAESQNFLNGGGI